MTLRVGDAGPEVAAAQQLLIEAGYPILQRETDPQRFGPSTESAVYGFQSAHVDLQGHALARDGIVGPATSWALQHPSAGGTQGFTAPGWRSDLSQEPEEVRQVLATAIGEIGTVEQPDGSNRGKRVDLYTQPDYGVPWCAAFVSWCWAKREGGSPFGRILSVHQLAAWGLANGRIVTEPRPGDIWCIFRDAQHGHAGLVVLSMPGELARLGFISTVEGNSGNAVRGLIRPVASIARFVRPLP